MCTAIVHNELNMSVNHPTVKIIEPFKENNLGHPCFCVAAVGATQVVDIDVLEASRFLEVSDDPQRKLVRTVPIAANGDSEALFVLLPTFQSLGCKGMVGLVT